MHIVTDVHSPAGVLFLPFFTDRAEEAVLQFIKEQTGAVVFYGSCDFFHFFWCKLTETWYIRSKRE
jgi:hypothetical protein